MAKVQKTYTREFKEEAVRLVQTSENPSRRLPENWAFQTRQFINGARS